MAAKITFVYNNAPSYTLTHCQIDRINWTTSMAYLMDASLNPLFIQEFGEDCLAVIEDDCTTMVIHRSPNYKQGVSVHTNITTNRQRMKNNNPDYINAKYRKWEPAETEWTPEVLVRLVG